MARLLRVARLLSVIPGLRIVVLGIVRSLAPIGSMAALTFFVLYMYGILGWLLYGDHDPERFGNIGRAMLTLFQILTLEGWNEVLDTQMELSSWSWVYFVSFVLIGTFVVLNVVIAIIVNSMDEVRAMELERERKELVAAALYEGEPDRLLHERLEALRGALDELEQALVDGAGPAAGQRTGEP
jgi:voltage-gated sodium channel